MNNSCECPVCGMIIQRDDNMVANEIIECSDCNSEMEVISINPFSLEEAPSEEEDWGQ